MKLEQKNIFSFFCGILLAVFIFFPFIYVLAEDLNVNATVPAICGNTVVEGAETCDDGDTDNGDGCSSLCSVEGGGGNGGGGAAAPDPVVPPPPVAQCQNGIVEAGEACDDGNNIDNDACSNGCVLPACGNGIRQGNEQCDDGDLDAGDGCDDQCVVEALAVCGNGQKEGDEQCDDGNLENGDFCSTQCVPTQPICGNGVREINEICDDGNVRNGDGCSAVCQVEIPGAVCGNNVVENGEQCDDGNQLGGDGCTNLCQREVGPVCRNGIREGNEQCDDGNNINNDGCDNVCRFVPVPGSICGNGAREDGEQCDDGNQAGGDGCSAACQIEVVGEVPIGDIPVVPVDPDVPVVPDPEVIDPEGVVPPVEIDAPIQENFLEEINKIGEEINKIEAPKIGTSTALFAQVKSDQPLVKNIAQVAQNLGKNISSGAKFVVDQGKFVAQVVEVVADNPQVEQTTKTVIAPTTAAVVVAAVAPSLASIVVPFFQFVFFQPLLLFGRKKRKTWGQVYNSLTKLPVDLALVRLLDGKTKKVLQSRVTDIQGRYFFITEPGNYVIEVTKPGFSFPSNLLQGIKSDGKLLDIYHGESVDVTESGIGITPNIPLDPAGAHKTPRRIVWEKRWKVFQHIIALSGIILTLIAIYIAPVWYLYVFLGIHVLAYFGFMRFVKPKKPTGWGLVYEKDSQEPLGSTVVRLFTKQYNKLVSTQVTDKKGRYAFLVGPSEYYVTYEKKGYKPVSSESLIIEQNQTDAIIKEKIGLEKV